MNPKTEIELLRAKLNHHNHLYHVLDSPEITDEEYDSEFQRLLRLEEKHPEFDDDLSPTKRVGGPRLKEFRPSVHRSPMLSLSNSFDDEQVEQFHERIVKTLRVGGRADLVDSLEYIVEPKLDGVAVNLVYEYGKLLSSATRGDGHTGEDVTQNAKTIRTIPLKLTSGPLPQLLEVRGEIVIHKDQFDRANELRVEEGKSPFANLRNAAAGSLRQLDSTKTAKRPLSMYCHSIGIIQGPENIDGHYALMTLLKGWGLQIVNSMLVRTPQELITSIQRIIANRDRYPYELDGAVIKVNSAEARQVIGGTSRTPSWATARKFKAEKATTIVESIFAQVGRTGAITPVALLKPVKVGGVTITHATLHNQGEVDRLGIGVGAKVELQRAGDVIPQITRVIEPSAEGGVYSLPTECPSCGHKTSYSDEEAAMRCTNPQCPAQIVATMEHFVSKKGLDIDGIGHSLLQLIYEHNLAERSPDLLVLEVDDLIQLPRVGAKSARNIYNAIQKARESQPSWRILSCLGIRLVGRRMSRTLTSVWPGEDGLAEILRGGNAHLSEVDGVGQAVQNSINEFVMSPRNKEDIRNLFMYINIENPVQKKGSDMLKGQTFCFTGKLTKFSRADAEAKVVENGGKALSGVSKNLNWLVAGPGAGSKLAKAEKLGVSVISEDEFLEMIK